MRALLGSAFLVLLGGVIGCGSSTIAPDFGGMDGEQIAALVDRMNDESHTTSKLKEIFAAGTKIGKKDTKGYSGYQYTLKSKPTVSGVDASGTVLIVKHAGGGPVEKEWSFVKEGDKWKIKSAPLP